MRITAMSISLAMLACDHTPATPEEECQEIYDHVTGLVGRADRSCATAADCTRPGGVGTCNCAFFLGVQCSGDPMNLEAYGAFVEATAGEAERFRTLNCAVGPMICDCGPGTVDCVGGQCTTVNVQSCFPQFDAGVAGP